MSGRYSVEDLLRLRASPLISKPSNLPAIEEILSASDAKAQRPSARRGADDANGTADTFSKRPLLDSQRKSTTDPDRLVLGPPRRSFASSNARAAIKGTLDPADENQGAREKNGFDRFRSPDPDRYPERRINGRFSKHDPDAPADERPRRRIDDLDAENKTRRENDRRPKWAADDDAEKEGRSERPSRAKFEQSWFRPDRGGDLLEDSAREGPKAHGWRDKRQDRSWDRPGQIEDEPEWLDEPVEEEKQAPARTQEDFQRWKEKMKAEKSANDMDQTPARPLSSGPIDAKSSKTFAPILDAEPDGSMDKFFARFNETKIDSEKPVVVAKPPSKSRFGSLFSPPPEAPQQRPPPLQPVTELPPQPPQQAERSASGIPSADAEKAGFARIMEMLNNRSNNPTLQERELRVQPFARDGHHQPEPDRPQQPPGLMALFGQPQGPARTQQAIPQDHIPESRSPMESHHGRQQSQKTDALLDLLRQANQAPKPTPASSRYNPDSFHAMMGDAARLREMANQGAVHRNQMISPASPPDPSVMAMLGRSENGRGPSLDEQQRMHYEALSRRTTQGAAEQPQQDQLLNFVRGFNQPPKPQQSQVPPPPPGLGRPIGPDQMNRPPQSWPAQPPHHQQQQPRQPAPPPGMSGPPRSQFGGPGVPQQPQPQRSQPQPSPRKYTGDFPPGMGPPPGFIGAPSGFQGPAYGGSQGMSRPQFMDMYSDGRGMRGNAAGGMQGYR